MPSFKYEIQNGGRTQAGVMEASSAQEVMGLLRAQGSYVLNVSAMAGAANLLTKIRNVKVELGPGLKDIQNFTNQLAVMLKAGISIRAAIEAISGQVENTRFRRILQAVRADVESGKPFSESLARHPKVFGPLYVNMVRASELSGSLGTMLQRIASHLAQQAETRSMVRGAMIYPAILGVMSVGATIFLLTFVLPRFATVFRGKEELLPKPTKMLLSLSGFLQHQWYLVVLGVAALAVGAFLFVRTPVGREKWDALKLRLPLMKKMLRSLYITRGLHTMSELIQAGVPMLETLSITADVSGNLPYKRMWMTVHDAVKQGSKIAPPLARHRLLPTNVVQMISAGEDSGKLGEVLRDVAEFHAKELKDAIKAVTAMLEPLMIVAMGCVVGFIAMSIILPIFKMSSLVK